MNKRIRNKKLKWKQDKRKWKAHEKQLELLNKKSEEYLIMGMRSYSSCNNLSLYRKFINEKNK